MDGIGNARFDVSEAILSLDTAIGVLEGLVRDGDPQHQAIRAVIKQLTAAREGLRAADEQLGDLPAARGAAIRLGGHPPSH